MAGIKPFSQACVNNQGPILAILEQAFADVSRVLEIGSGTGQHAVYFAPGLPHLRWQPSDRQENIAGIHAWMDDHPSRNLSKPLVLDVDLRWPKGEYDGVFTANTCHIMSWQSVINLFQGVGRLAAEDTSFAIYGPFKYGGKFTTESNANFDQWLRTQGSHQGVRNIEDIVELAAEQGFSLVKDYPMPANNQLLLFRN